MWFDQKKSSALVKRPLLCFRFFHTFGATSATLVDLLRQSVVEGLKPTSLC
jgi:hypothetical protein